MKILFINTNPIFADGITSMICNLVRSIDDVTMQIDLVAINEPTESVKMVFELRSGKIYVLHRSMNHVLAYVKGLVAIIKSGKYDAVHVHGSSATMVLEMLAALLAGCNVRIAHSHSTSCNHILLHRLMTPLFRTICTHRLACGDAAGKWLFGKLAFNVVNNGIDTSRFAFSIEEREKTRKVLGLTESNIAICHVGVFNENKNQSFLVDVMTYLTDNYRLILIGDGGMRKEVEEKVSKLNMTDRVHFIGITDKVQSYLSACDLVAMPSKYEGLPLSLIEQQANGLMCLVSDTITSEVNKSGNVVFSPLCEGPKLWADRIRSLSSLSEDRNKTSKIAIENIISSGYDIKSEASNLANYYRRC